MNKFYLIFILLVAVFLIFTAFSGKLAFSNSAGNDELIKFSHSLHYELAECADCHSNVSKSISMNDRLLPNHDNCKECHDVDNSDECETCHINDNYEPLIQTKATIIFNHSVHTEQNIECTFCHKGLDEVDYSFESTEYLPAMETCSGCHNETKIASNACESCHVSTFNLTPVNHRTVDFIRSHKYLAADVNANCMMCHDNQTCEDCHVSTTMITEDNSTDNFYQPYMPGQSIDGTKQQVITRVHDLNFRFSHGIDARNKSAECQTCHQIETFCAECHQSEGGDFALGGNLPVSHLMSGFTTFGVGSGGGEHAVFAKRDLESCISCHDIQGGDPTCIICHLDSDGIKGTDPKTHAVNFMRDEEGDWHNSKSSVCFNCHTSAITATNQSDGFCNYCHQ